MIKCENKKCFYCDTNGMCTNKDAVKKIITDVETVYKNVETCELENNKYEEDEDDDSMYYFDVDDI